MMRGTVPPVPAARLDLSVAAKEWASADTGATVIGVVAGISVGEWMGSMVSEYFNLEAGWADVAGKAVGKGILSFVLYIIGRRTGGWMHILLNGAAIGSLASIVGDIIAQFTAPGFGLGLGTSAASTKGITVKVDKTNAPAIGATGSVITSIAEV